MEVFDHLHFFEIQTTKIYGKKEEIHLLHMDLFLKSLGYRLRFVFAITSLGPIVLMCSNLTESPIDAIELYCLRTRIETMFNMLKNLVGGFQCHFWSKKMPRHSRKPCSNKILKSPKKEDLHTINACWKATEGFVMIGCIALGLLQLIASKFSNPIWNSYQGFLRTKSRAFLRKEPQKM